MSHIFTFKQPEATAKFLKFRMFCHLIVLSQRQHSTTLHLPLFCLLQEKCQWQQVASSSVTLCFLLYSVYVMFSFVCHWEDGEV